MGVKTLINHSTDGVWFQVFSLRASLTACNANYKATRCPRSRVHLRDSGSNTLSMKRTRSVALRRKPDRHVNVLASYAGSKAFCASRRSMAQKLVICYSTTLSEVKGRSDRLHGMRFFLKNYSFSHIYLITLPSFWSYSHGLRPSDRSLIPKNPNLLGWRNVSWSLFFAMFILTLHIRYHI